MVPAYGPPAPYPGPRSGGPVSGRWRALFAPARWQPQWYHCRVPILRQSRRDHVGERRGGGHFCRRHERENGELYGHTRALCAAGGGVGDQRGALDQCRRTQRLWHCSDSSQCDGDCRADQYCGRRGSHRHMVGHPCDVVFGPLDHGHDHDGLPERETHGYDHLYHELYGGGWYCLRQYDCHGNCSTQRDSKCRVYFHHFRPGCDPNVVGHPCDVVFGFLDHGHDHDGLPERETHGYDHLYHELYGGGWHCLRQYDCHGNCPTQRDSKCRAHFHHFRPGCDPNVVGHPCDVVFGLLDHGHDHDGLPERETHGYDNLYHELYGGGWYCLRQYDCHGNCPTQRDSKCRAHFHHFRPGCDPNVVGHLCDVVFGPLDHGHDHDGLPERETHGYDHLYHELYKSKWHCLRQYDCHDNCPTQRDSKCRAHFHHFRPGCDPNVIGHPCDVVFGPLDHGHDHDGLPERETHDYDHLYHELYKSKWHCLRQYDCHDNCPTQRDSKCRAHFHHFRPGCDPNVIGHPCDVVFGPLDHGHD